MVDRIEPIRTEDDYEAALDRWERAIAPSAALRQWFGHDPARWDEFGGRYRKELAARTGW